MVDHPPQARYQTGLLAVLVRGIVAGSVHAVESTELKKARACVSGSASECSKDCLMQYTMQLPNPESYVNRVTGRNRGRGTMQSCSS